MKGLLKIRRIGNSTGTILPKKMGAKIGDKIPYSFHNGKLTLNFRYDLAKKRAHIINKAFDTDHYYTEEQMEKKFSGWGDK